MMKLHSGDRKDIGEARVQSASRQGKESERMGWWGGLGMQRFRVREKRGINGSVQHTRNLF